MKTQFFDEAGIKSPDGRYFVLQDEVDPAPPPPSRFSLERSMRGVGNTIRPHPECVSYSYRVRASLIVTVHGSMHNFYNMAS